MNNPKQKKKANPKGLFRDSLLLGALERFTKWIYASLAGGFFGRTFTAYDRANEKFMTGLVHSAATEKDEGSSVVTVARKRIAKSFESSRILALVHRFLCHLLTCRLSVYGILLFAFGVYSAALYPIHLLFPGVRGTFTHLVVGTCTAVAALPILFSGESVASALIRSRGLAHFLFHILGVHPGSLSSLARKKPVGHLNFAFLAGVLLGLLSSVLSPIVILLAIPVLLLLCLILTTPELGVLLAFFVTPFAPTMVMVALICYTFGAYVLKLVLYKRTFRFELIDFSVIAFMAVVLLGGLISVNVATSVKSMLVFLCFMLGYVLTVNLIRTRDWFRRCALALILSATCVSLYGLFQYLSGSVSTKWQDLTMFATIDGRVTSTLENPNVLAEYLVMVAPFAAAYLLIRGRAGSKFGFFFSGVAMLGCLVLTYSRGGWLGFLFAAVAFLLIYHRRSIYLLVLGVAALPFAVAFLPASIVQRFTSIGNLGDSSTSYRVYIWRAVVNMIADNPICGIGIGEGAFSKVYPLYSLSGIETAPHSHNLFLQITLETGVIGLLIFLAFLFFFAQHMITGFKNAKTPQDRIIPAAGFCGIFGVLVQGMTDYVWYNYRVFLIFWLIIGLSCAYLRIDTRTHALENTSSDLYRASVDLVYEEDHRRMRAHTEHSNEVDFFDDDEE